MTNPRRRCAAADCPNWVALDGNGNGPLCCSRACRLSHRQHEMLAVRLSRKEQARLQAQQRRISSGGPRLTDAYAKTVWASRFADEEAAYYERPPEPHSDNVRNTAIAEQMQYWGDREFTA